MLNNETSSVMPSTASQQAVTALFDRSMSNTELIPFLVVHTLITISNITANSFLFNTIRKLKKSASISFMFIKCLCISDIIVGTLQLMYVIFRSCMAYYDPKTIVILDLLMQTMFYVASPFSGGMILIIAADRYVHMKYLIKYNQIMTSSRAWMLIVSNLIFQLAISVSLLIASMQGYFFIQQPMLVSAYVLMLSTAVVLYGGAYRSIKRRTRNSSVGIEPLSSSPMVERRDPSFDFSKAMVYVLISLVICYAPFLVLTTTRSLLLWSGKQVPHSVMYALLWTYNLNFGLSTLNAIIFIMLNRDLKVYAKQLVGKRQDRRGSSQWIQWEEFSMAQVRPKIHRLTVVSSPW